MESTAVPSSVDPTRVRILRDGPPRTGRYVLYWMQSSQRTTDNPALRYATERADSAGLPLVVFFGLDRAYPESNLRHFRFMAEGLSDVARSLEELGIFFALRAESPAAGACRLARDASLMVVDRGYLRPQLAMEQYAAEHCACPLVQVEGNVVVPVETASPKEEYSAATLRPKAERLLDRFLHPVATEPPRFSARFPDIPTLAGEPADAILSHAGMDRSVPASPLFKGGSAEARIHDLILFGSSCRGGERIRGSDIDIAVISEDFAGLNPRERALLTRDAERTTIRKFRIPLDILTLTVDEQKDPASLLYRTLRDGIPASSLPAA